MKQILFLSAIMLLVFEAAAKENHKPEKNNIAGKLFFSNQRFSSSNSGNKKSFTSHEYIYGRLELDSSSIKEVFKIKDSDDTYPYLQCGVTIFKEGREIDSENSSNYFYFLINEEEKGRSWLNFDILPEPSNATTVYAMVNDFSGGLGYNPLYRMIVNSRLPDGNYRVHISIYSVTVDGWGKQQPREKWPLIEDDFEFSFSEDDIARVQKNKDLTADIIKENAFRYDKLPDAFFNSAIITDPKATNAKITTILKRDLPDRVILKVGIEKTGGTLWNVDKGDDGLPRYRYFSPTVYVAYKMDGKCYVGDVTLRETYEGGGRYGPLEVGFTSASNQQDKGIDCNKIK